MGEPGTAALARDVPTANDGETAAWIGALALALLAVPLIALLAKPVGTLIVPHVDRSSLFPWAQTFFHPKPRDQGMYVLALAAAALLAAVILFATWRPAALRGRVAGGLVLVARAGLGLVLAASIVGQYRIRYEWTQGFPHDRFFTPATLVAGALIAATIVAAVRGDRTRRAFAALLRDSRGRRIGALALAAAFTAVWMLHAVQSDTSYAWMPGTLVGNLPYSTDETFALLNGLTPFVDFTPAYALLASYVLAAPLLVFGQTMFVFTLAAATITALALLAGFGVLRRATGTSVGALLLYLPFLSTSLFIFDGHPGLAFTVATYLGDFPLRYAGPLVLAWLTARELQQSRPRAPWALFAAGGLVLLNNAGVGLPALAATLAACVATRPSTRRSLRELARGVACGMAVAVAAVTLLTLARSGSLPHFGELSEFSRFYLAGFRATPLHSVLGLHLAIYLTFVAAIVVAVVRVRGGATGAVMTGMLLWNGIFGLGALSYFVAESGQPWLLASFSSWALTTMLLAALAVGALARREARRPEPAQLAVLFGVGVMTCSLAQFATPWSQIESLLGSHRSPLTAAAPLPFRPDPRARTFVAALADGQRFYLKHGAPVAILVENSHRLAGAYGVVNVSPYANAWEIYRRASLRRVVDRLRAAGGNTLIAPWEFGPGSDLAAMLASLEFGVVTAHGIARLGKGVQPAVRTLRGEQAVKWIDLRTSHPRALQGGHATPVSWRRVLTD